MNLEYQGALFMEKMKKYLVQEISTERSLNVEISLEDQIMYLNE